MRSAKYPESDTRRDLLNNALGASIGKFYHGDTEFFIRDAAIKLAWYVLNSHLYTALEVKSILNIAQVELRDDNGRRWVKCRG
jgi:hypothetical protein